MRGRWAKRRELQDRLLEATGCGIQHTGWPCGTCFHSLGLRTEDAWHATLVLRGDYKDGEYGIDMPDARLELTVDALLREMRRRVQ